MYKILPSFFTYNLFNINNKFDKHFIMSNIIFDKRKQIVKMYTLSKVVGFEYMPDKEGKR